MQTSCISPAHTLSQRVLFRSSRRSGDMADLAATHVHTYTRTESPIESKSNTTDSAQAAALIVTWHDSRLSFGPILSHTNESQTTLLMVILTNRGFERELFEVCEIYWAARSNCRTADISTQKTYSFPMATA